MKSHGRSAAETRAHRDFDESVKIPCELLLTGSRCDSGRRLLMMSISCFMGFESWASHLEFEFLIERFAFFIEIGLCEKKWSVDPIAITVPSPNKTTAID